jgi:anti-anti-sigma regulatory factor
VTYIGVQGIAALLNAATNAQHRDVAFSVANCSPQVLRLLAVVDPDHILTVRIDSGRAGRPRSSGCARTRYRSKIRSMREKR